MTNVRSTEPATVLCLAAVLCLAGVVAFPARSVAQSAGGYDPLRVGSGSSGQVLDLTVMDRRRMREIPIRVHLTAGALPAAVVLFSHGLGGSRENSAYLAEHWARRGYVTVSLQHPGSDESVWKNQPVRRRMAAMRRAASAQNLILRVEDVACVLDQLERWSHERGHPLAGRVDLSRVGMSGHSFGAITTQAVSGQELRLVGQRYTDSRIKAALAMSPSAPRGGDARQAFGAVRIPWMLMTGTKDEAVIGDADLQSRLGVFPALPPGDNYEVVLFEAEHSAFSDRPLPFDRVARNPNHHRVILALSTAFWDAHLGGSAEARAWLDGNGPRSVMEPGDAWHHK